jgi:hypothetical protein
MMANYHATCRWCRHVRQTDPPAGFKSDDAIALAMHPFQLASKPTCVALSKAGTTPEAKHSRSASPTAWGNWFLRTLDSDFSTACGVR